MKKNKKRYQKRVAAKKQRRLNRLKKAKQKHNLKIRAKLQNKFNLENGILPKKVNYCGGTIGTISKIKPIGKIGTINKVDNSPRRIVDLSKKSGVKAVLKALTNENAARSLDKQIFNEAKKLLDNIDKFNNPSYQSVFRSLIGFSGENETDYKQVPITLRKVNGKVYAILPRNIKVVGKRKFANEIGYIMANWDNVNQLLNEVNANAYKSDFFSGTYQGWAQWVINQLGLDIPEQLFIFWVKDLINKDWPKIYNLGFNFINGLINKKLSKKEIEKVIGKSDLNNINEDDYIKILSKLYKKL